MLGKRVLSTLCISVLAICSVARASEDRVERVQDAQQFVSPFATPFDSVDQGYEELGDDEVSEIMPFGALGEGRIETFGAPRGGGLCQDVIFDNQINGVTPPFLTDPNISNVQAFAGGRFRGAGVTFAQTQRAVCQVIIPMSLNTAGPGAENRTITLRIYDQCPFLAPDTCGNPNATLLHEQSPSVAIQSVNDPVSNITLVTFNVPDVVVPNSAYFMFTGTTDVRMWITTRAPNLGLSIGSMTICGNPGSTVNGCDTWGFNVGGVFKGQLLFMVVANPTGELGACCLNESGTCVSGVTAEDCAESLFGTFFAGQDCMEFMCPAPCNVEPLMNDLVEGEGACTVGDEFNSGCNSGVDPVGGAFNSPALMCGQSVFGTCGIPTLGGLRDTDWYRLDLTGEAGDTLVTVTLQAEFPASLIVFDDSGANCTTDVVVGSAAGAPCTTLSTTVCLPPGIHSLFVSADLNLFRLLVPRVLCDGSSNNNEYRLSVECDPNCITVECDGGDTGQIGNLTGNGGLISLSTNGTIEAADNFSPTANGNVNGARIYGKYNLPGFAICNLNLADVNDNWVVTYYRQDDINDLPGPVIAQFTEGVDMTVTRSLTGRQQASGAAEVQVDISHANVPVTAGNCFWIGVDSNSASTCFFSWYTSPDGDGRSAQRGDSGTAWALADVETTDLAMCLSIDSGAVAVPIATDGCASSTDFVGACCLTVLGGGANANGCAVLPFGDCVSQGGIFFGFDTTCAETNCNGACCTGIDSCSIVTYEACFSATGNIFAFQGIATTCADSPCAAGACCFVDGSCQDTTSTAGFPPVFESNCSPVVLSTTAPNIWDRTGLPLPMSAVGGFTAGASCDFITQAPCPQPNIAAATTIPCNGALTFNNLGLGPAGLSGGDNGGGGAVFNQPDVSCLGGGVGELNGAFWVTFTATAAQTQVTTCGSLVNDTVLAVYEDSPVGAGGFGSVNEGTEIACNEDAANPCGGDPSNFNAEVCLDTNIGQTYWVQVGSFSVAEQGVIEVAINCASDVCDVAVCATCTGDVNGDNSRDGRDVQAFTTDILGPANNPCSDFNSSGATDLGDIPGFVAAILGGGC